MYDAPRTSLDSYSDAACLAHSIPGVALRLRDPINERDILVSSACLAAPLDPCQFRTLVIGGRSGQSAAIGQFASVDVVGGLVHLGGGMYQPSHPGAADDRWFVSTLDDARVSELLATCPLPAAADDAFSVVVKPDADLGRCAVRVRCDSPAARAHLDEVALWSLSACLVDELVVTCHPHPTPDNPTEQRSKPA